MQLPSNYDDLIDRTGARVCRVETILADLRVSSGICLLHKVGRLLITDMRYHDHIILSLRYRARVHPPKPFEAHGL